MTSTISKPRPLHTPFGIFRGLRKSMTIQYLGLKFATLKNQLAPPELNTAYPAGIIDCTKYGPRVVAPDACHYEQTTIIQKVLDDTPPAPPMSGTECLNLNITVPDLGDKGALQESNLPVMVFIHGGGYVMGANWWPQYDPAGLVRLSVEMGRPVFVVNVNYRLGVLGNVTSEALRTAGYPGNNSLRDQICALRWVKRFVAGFGGDPGNVTVFGESAGGSSVLSLLSSKEPLFKRGIAMSGTPLMIRPLSLEQTEDSYNRVTALLGIEAKTPEEQIQYLIKISPEDLISANPTSMLSIPLRPHLDNDIIPISPTFAGLASGSINLPGHTWCEQLMLGDCAHDGNVIHFMGLGAHKAGLAAKICTSLSSTLSSSSAAAILAAYQLEPNTDDDAAWRRVIDLATDIMYAVPARLYARHCPGAPSLRTYYYNFNQENPWEGTFQGYSTHGLDIVFLMQAYSQYLAPEDREVAVAFGRDVVRFACGEEPWGRYDGHTTSVRRYGGDERARRECLLRLRDEGVLDLDEVMEAFLVFVGTLGAG